MKSVFWLMLGLMVVGCAGGEEPTSEAPEESATSGGDGSAEGEAPMESSLEGTTTVAGNPFAVPDDASEALQQAEWLREEQARGYRMLEMRLERGDLPCDEAQSVATRLCTISDEVCDQAGIDQAARPQCNDAMERCGATRALMREQPCD